MAEQYLPNPTAEPHFLTYLLAQDTKHDCYFIVGKQELVEPKKIGAVKTMLMAHSSVLRAQLNWEESRLAEKEVVRVEVDDLYPDTFIILLKYVYGHDTTASLSFEEADDLLYAAEKYMMEPLKASLSSRLTVLLTPDNICQLLNNPACYGTLELQSAITEILQCETARVLDSPAFLDLDLDGFTKILEQETMNVEEIQVWRAAVKWAKHRGGTEDGKVLSEQLSEPLKHIRVCTISSESFLQEVVPTNILNDLSLKMVYLYHGKTEKQSESVQVSNEIKPRMLKPTMDTLEYICVDFPTDREEICKYGYFYCYTKGFGVELLPLEFRGAPSLVISHVRIQITKFSFDLLDTSTEPPVIYVTSCERVEPWGLYQVPLTINGENIRLHPNNKYKVAVRFLHPHKMYLRTVPFEQASEYCSYLGTTTFNHEHMWLEFPHHYGYCWSPVKRLRYKPIDWWGSN